MFRKKHVLQYSCRDHGLFYSKNFNVLLSSSHRLPLVEVGAGGVAMSDLVTPLLGEGTRVVLLLWWGAQCSA